MLKYIVKLQPPAVRFIRPDFSGKKILAFFLLLISLTNFLYASYDLSDANQAFKEQDYKKAQEMYLKIADQGVKNFTLFYNLGNTFFKLGKIAKLDFTMKKLPDINHLTRICNTI